MTHLKLQEIRDYSMRGVSLREMGPKKWALRWVSIIFTYILQYTPITANQVSFLAVFFVIGAAYVFSFGSFLAGIIAVVLLYFGEIWDYVDGTLARCKKANTKVQGYFVGFTYHEAAVSFLFAGLGFGVYTTTGDMKYFFLGLIGSFAHLLNVYFLNLKGFLVAKYSDHFKDKKDKATVFTTPKTKKLLFLFAFPVNYSKEIILVVILIQKLEFLVFFYAFFLPIRTVLFFGYTYYMLGKFQQNLDLK